MHSTSKVVQFDEVFADKTIWYAIQTLCETSLLRTYPASYNHRQAGYSGYCFGFPQIVLSSSLSMCGPLKWSFSCAYTWRYHLSATSHQRPAASELREAYSDQTPARSGNNQQQWQARSDFLQATSEKTTNNHQQQQTATSNWETRSAHRESTATRGGRRDSLKSTSMFIYVQGEENFNKRDTVDETWHTLETKYARGR